jgi:hypothetical protein
MHLLAVVGTVFAQAAYDLAAEIFNTSGLVAGVY